MTKHSIGIFDVEVHHSNGVTMALVVSQVDGKDIIYTATARCHPTDKFSTEVGARIAIARALAKMAKSLDARATGLVKHRDDMKAYKVKQKKRAARREQRTGSAQDTRVLVAT